VVNRITGEVFRPNCRKPLLCKQGASRYQSRTRKRLYGGKWRAVVTLTMPPAFGEPTRANIRLQSKSWSRLLKILRRKFPTPFYFAFIREHNGGRLHLNVFWTIPWVSDISRLAEKVGFGKIINARKLWTTQQRIRQVRYATKCLALTNSDPDGYWPAQTRRVQTNLPPLPTQPKGTFYQIPTPSP
jgi:hypothetical protein